MIKGEIRWAKGQHIHTPDFSKPVWDAGKWRLQQAVYERDELVWRDVPEVTLQRTHNERD